MIVVRFGIVPVSTLDWIATATSVVHVEELAKLLLALLVLLSGQNCLTRGVGCILLDDL